MGSVLASFRLESRCHDFPLEVLKQVFDLWLSLCDPDPDDVGPVLVKDPDVPDSQCEWSDVIGHVFHDLNQFIVVTIGNGADVLDRQMEVAVVREITTVGGSFDDVLDIAQMAFDIIIELDCEEHAHATTSLSFIIAQNGRMNTFRLMDQWG
jgi:hypothetical protein